MALEQHSNNLDGSVYVQLVVERILSQTMGRGTYKNPVQKYLIAADEVKMQNGAATARQYFLKTPKSFSHNRQDNCSD